MKTVKALDLPTQFLLFYGEEQSLNFRFFSNYWLGFFRLHIGSVRARSATRPLGTKIKDQLTFVWLWQSAPVARPAHLQLHTLFQLWKSQVFIPPAPEALTLSENAILRALMAAIEVHSKLKMMVFVILCRVRRSILLEDWKMESRLARLRILKRVFSLFCCSPSLGANLK